MHIINHCVFDIIPTSKRHLHIILYCFIIFELLFWVYFYDILFIYLFVYICTYMFCFVSCMKGQLEFLCFRMVNKLTSYHKHVIIPNITVIWASKSEDRARRAFFSITIVRDYVSMNCIIFLDRTSKRNFEPSTVGYCVFASCS